MLIERTLKSLRLVPLLWITCTGLVNAEEALLQLDQTVISGNQELPKVLYILPWRDPDGLPEVEVQGALGETDVFRRLYPPAYRRELSYYDTLVQMRANDDAKQE